MGFVAFFLATWLAVLSFYLMPKSLSFLENAVVLLVVIALGVNVSWIIIEELSFMQLTKDPLLYTAYLLNRSIVIPLVYVIWLNVLYLKISNEISFLATVCCTGLVLGLNGLAVYYQIFTYSTWNPFYDSLVVVTLQITIYLVHKLAAKWMYGGVERI
jgi:hypothetical protein